jgi:hypothetical protein
MYKNQRGQVGVGIFISYGDIVFFQKLHIHPFSALVIRREREREREREGTSNRDRPYEATTRECTFKFHGRANGMALRRSWAPKRSMPICLAACPTTDQTAQALKSVLFSERTMSTGAC